MTEKPRETPEKTLVRLLIEAKGMVVLAERKFCTIPFSERIIEEEEFLELAYPIELAYFEELCRERVKVDSYELPGFAAFTLSYIYPEHVEALILDQSDWKKRLKN